MTQLLRYLTSSLLNICSVILLLFLGLFFPSLRCSISCPLIWLSWSHFLIILCHFPAHRSISFSYFLFLSFSPTHPSSLLTSQLPPSCLTPISASIFNAQLSLSFLMHPLSLSWKLPFSPPPIPYLIHSLPLSPSLFCSHLAIPLGHELYKALKHEHRRILLGSCLPFQSFALVQNAAEIPQLDFVGGEQAVENKHWRTALVRGTEYHGVPHWVWKCGCNLDR